MAKPIRFSPVKTSHGWRLNIPAKLSQTGKRQQLHYPIKQKALDAANDLKAKVAIHGQQARAIAPSLAEQATAAAKLLEPLGASLLEAARFYVAAKGVEATSKPTNQATAEWLATCEEKLRVKTVTGYRQTMKRFESFGARMLSTLSRDELQNALAPAGMTATTAASHIRAGSAFWRWAAKREWCDGELIDKLDKPEAPKRKRIDFLTPEAARCLLETAAKHYPASVAHFAIGLFAGVRPAELQRLAPSHVAADSIEIGDDESKGESRRHITPCETLSAWLKKHPFQTVPNWSRVWDAVRRLAGWDVASEFADKLASGGVELLPANRGPWSQDVMRHTCGTYTVARGEDLAGMAFWFGHSGGETTLRRYYVGKAKRKQALEFFSIAPEGVKLETLIAV